MLTMYCTPRVLEENVYFTTKTFLLPDVVTKVREVLNRASLQADCFNFGG